uniref:ribonuclease H n=1 Tax=Anolis carolinensis TaxID=28377 RepID=A0A803TIV3_ANOCA
MVFLEERMSAMETTLAVMSRAMERLEFLAEPERGRELRAGSMWDMSVGSSQGFADLPAPKGRGMRKEPSARPKTQTSLTRVEESDDEGEKPPRIPATLPAETLVPLANAGCGTGPGETAAGPTGPQGGLRWAEDWGLPPQGPLPRREELRIEFGGESSELDFFLTMVRGYMEDNAHTFRTESSRIQAIGAVLKRGAASWYVQLHARRDPCLGSVRRFMGAPETRFQDPLEQIRAREKLKTVSQGQRSVSEYAEEFQCLAEKVPEWSAVTKMELFKEGLRREILSWAVHHDEPDTLHGWIQLAGRVETSLAQARRHRGGLQQRPQMKEGSRKEGSTPTGRRAEPRGNVSASRSGCFVCGRLGHRAAECWQRKGEGGGPPKPRAVAGKRAEEEPPMRDHSGGLVSQDKAMIVVPIQLENGSKQATYKAFVDCGCSRNIISPELAGGLGCERMSLESPIAFSQLDGSTASGSLARHSAEDVKCKIGSWEGKVSFVISQIANYNVILGMPWLGQANTQINWEDKSMIFGMSLEEGSQEVEREPGKRGEEDSIRIAELADKLPPEYRDFVDVFDEKEADNFPPKRRVEVKIELVPGAELPKAKIYPMSAREKEELRKYIDKNLARGFIEPSNSPLGAPVLFRRKKDQTLRLCIDYRGLNAISTVNKYPLPLVKDLIAQLSEGQIFTKLDLIEAYHKLQMNPEDRWKTAFSCAFGLFNYCVLPFGLCGGGAAFMQLINEVLHPLLYKGVFIFLDDILIMSRTKKQHVELVREVLQKLREAKLYAKLAKCEFNKDQIDFLGYRISSQGVAMDPAKVEDVRGWEAPRTRKQLQSFLGFANFYRTFIKDFARLTLPLTDLLKTKGRGETAKVKAPGAKLTWTIECQEAFEALKKRFTEEPVLQHPDVSKTFVIHCDASDRAYGAVLLQKDEGGNLKPCGYLSKKFSDTEKNWPIWEREALAILKALECWRHFLEGSGIPFEVWSDHKNLQYLRSPRKLSAKQIRWAQYFSRFDFRLKFFQGKHNILADALSRMPQHGGGIQESEGSLFLDKQWGLAVLTRAQAAKENKRTAISTGGGEIWEEELKRAYGMDEWLQTKNRENCVGIWCSLIRNCIFLNV